MSIERFKSRPEETFVAEMQEMENVVQYSPMRVELTEAEKLSLRTELENHFEFNDMRAYLRHLSYMKYLDPDAYHEIVTSEKFGQVNDKLWLEYRRVANEDYAAEHRISADTPAQRVTRYLRYAAPLLQVLPKKFKDLYEKFKDLYAGELNLRDFPKKLSDLRPFIDMNINNWPEGGELFYGSWLNYADFLYNARIVGGQELLNEFDPKAWSAHVLDNLEGIRETALALGYMKVLDPKSFEVQRKRRPIEGLVSTLKRAHEELAPNDIDISDLWIYGVLQADRAYIDEAGDLRMEKISNPPADKQLPQRVKFPK